MIKYSTWNKIDIHIHSKKSNEVKTNDYKGDEYDGKQILDKMLKENVNIFSITDHNCINEKLYKEIECLIKNEEYNGKVNYLLGVELDIIDEKIYDKVFHCLCFFGSTDIDKVKKSIDSIFNGCNLSERNNMKNYPSVSQIFTSLNKNEIQDIILIPHFNRKSKGLPTDIAIENLNYLCFNAYEDSNNIENIDKSLKIYLQAGYDNFPFAVFSDCHNLDNYPGVDSDKFTPCYMLSNLEYPFNSIKTAFQEPRLRISLSNVENIREIKKPENFIEKIFSNGIYYDLSPYQNTIVGKFGSGKSLLLEKIKNGSASLQNNKKYSDFFSQEDSFKLYVSNNPVNSVNEMLSINKNIKKYEFLQQEDYSFKSNLNLDEAKSLFDRINIIYNFIENKHFEFNDKNLLDTFNDLYSKINSTGDINNLNYEKAFYNEEYFSVNLNEYVTDYSKILDDLKNNKNDIEVFKNKKVSEISLFDANELESIDKITKIINKKINIIKYLNDSTFEKDLTNLLNDYNKNYVKNTAKQSKDKFINKLDELLLSIECFENNCYIFNSKYNVKIYQELKKPFIQKIYDNYYISATYNNLDEYKSPIKSIFKECNRKETLFSSFISLLSSKEKFLQNKQCNEFESVLKKYCDSITDLYKETNVAYDILCGGESMLKKSAGEKSSLFIKLIFDLIENDLKNDKSVLLILDQPESNIDNDNIYKEISNKLRKLKISYNNLQSIIVTHNANVGIAADSENIIIAKEVVDIKNVKSFEYRLGCIENSSFIKDVCNILEGGKDAMKKRTTKYGINIIKKVNKNEL